MKPAAADADDHLAMYRPTPPVQGVRATTTRARVERRRTALRRWTGGLLVGCVALAGCVSVRPLDLVQPDRVAQTSLVLDADGRMVAALHGPEDRTAVRLG
jgi:hypothetical protein